jgi:hypothetical protein
VEHVYITTEGAPAMRGLTIGIALAAVVFLATGGHFLLIPLLIPLGFVAFLSRRAAWRPGSTTYRRVTRRPGPI